VLRRGARTVGELAEAVDLTDNAVRAQLAALERDGLVRQGSAQGGGRRGPGKPATLYHISPDGERLFAKAYAPVLSALLDVLSDRLPATELDAIARETGHRLAADQAPPSGTLETRIQRGVALLGQLGGLAEVERRDDGYVIRGYSCPTAAVVTDHPELCQIAASLLSDVIGAPVVECCDRGDPPRCRFSVSAD
jgi:predicted ArsR family transcriptional regulator